VTSQSISSRLPLRAALKSLLGNVLGGGVASIMTVAFGLSYSLLIFSGPLAPYLSYGIAATFIASAVLGALIAIRSSFPFAIAGPDSSTAAVTGILAASVAERMLETDPSTSPLAPVLFTIALATVATGIMLCGVGITRMGRVIRYVPYPVVGGFLGATGCLVLLGAVRVVTDHRLQFATLGQFDNVLTLSKLAAACAMALIVYLTWHRSRSWFRLPAILVGSIVGGHILFWLAGISSAQAQTMGWIFLPPPGAKFLPPWGIETIRNYPWQILPELSGHLIAVVFVTATGALLHITGVEVATNHEANLERELGLTGVANILSGVLGGYTGCIAASRTLLNFNSGGTTPLSGLTGAAISLSMLAFAAAMLGYMPKFVLGGLLIYLGADQLYKWIVLSRHRLSIPEYLSLLAIIFIIVQWGFIAGVLTGIVIGCATFALSASHIEAIKFGFDGTEFRSSLDRSGEDQALLAVHGAKIQGLNLQSYLFFGSANRLHQRVKTLLTDHPQCRFLVFDFKLVTGVDSSAAYSFAQIKRTAQDRGIRLVLVHLPATAEKALRSSEFISPGVSIMPELDHALEWCENEIIAQHRDREQEEASLHEWFTRILGSDEDAAELIRRCERLEVEEGAVIVRAGQAANFVYFILEGRVGVMVPAREDGGATRVRSLGRYTTVGEMGVVSKAPRTATIRAEVASILYQLTAHQFETIRIENPPLCQKLLTYFVAVMAERLTFANRTIAALRR
jgi:SulP family sulfate permease